MMTSEWSERMFRLVVVLCFCTTNTLGFEVIWNIPSKQCRAVNPGDHNLTINKFNNFYGEKVVLFYETFGLFPFCTEELKAGEKKPECVPINGGVPQAANLTAHLEKAANDIENAIPNKDFDGYGVIDYEAWRPLYELNWSSRRIYQRYSRKLVQQATGMTDVHQVEHLARAIFDQAAKNFIVETIKLAKKLRPKAKWGYWEYPLCDYQAGYDQLECLEYYNDFNDQLSYIPANSDVLYPAIYYYGKEDPEARLKHSYARIKQTYDYAAKFNKNLGIIPYIKIEYSPSDSVDAGFYNKTDLCASIKYPMEIGAEAVIIWSSSYRIKQRCSGLEEYLKKQLGPFVTEVRRKAKKCRESHCSDHGRCSMKEISVPHECHLGHTIPNPTCICDEGFTGEHCQHQRLR